jgi:hypothetical protein
MLGGGGKANGRFYDFQRPLPCTLTVNLGLLCKALHSDPDQPVALLESSR